jgi:hypothetical protein
VIYAVLQMLRDPEVEVSREIYHLRIYTGSHIQQKQQQTRKGALSVRSVSAYLPREHLLLLDMSLLRMRRRDWSGKRGNVSSLALKVGMHAVKSKMVKSSPRTRTYKNECGYKLNSSDSGSLSIGWWSCRMYCG